ncbi:leucine-rich repeat-containing protein 58 isoform X1 [Xiphophorus couchianus]|uniref:leucine-rich repeat-containing protein 58 isoform X1 n=1 Tax=Xiphophorus couchianus TaxID=32473 RepID=UPI0010166E68|nr:leucine-rich repeat-containing protein 58 isoform X1 [Xiphophorus couchianus]
MESQEGAAAATRDCVLDFSRLSLNTFNVNNVSEDRQRDTRQLFLNYNRLYALPSSVSLFYNLELLDISNNGLTTICEGITRLAKLKTLLAKNNRLDEFSLPKEFGSLQLEVLNFSGNRFQEIPLQCTKLLRLQSLSIGGNRLKSIPAEIEYLTSLEMLYLGGNLISDIPPELAHLPYLTYLVLCDNRIQSVPPQLARLHSLRSLSLHNNLLTYLPREILSLVHLQELSLRGNPLVVRFVKEMIYDPPSLLELAGRTIKSRNIPYFPYDMPSNLVLYLDLASKCPNPKCADDTQRQFQQMKVFTLIHACDRSNSLTSVGSTGCPSCTTCAPRSALLPAAPTLRATQSLRRRTASLQTASKGSCWVNSQQENTKGNAELASNFAAHTPINPLHTHTHTQ